MITNNQKIPCPDCGGDILFTVELLLAGAQFQCTMCNAAISLNTNSTPIVKETVDKFSELKGGLVDKKSK